MYTTKLTIYLLHSYGEHLFIPHCQCPSSCANSWYPDSQLAHPPQDTLGIPVWVDPNDYHYHPPLRSSCHLHHHAPCALLQRTGCTGRWSAGLLSISQHHLHGHWGHDWTLLHTHLHLHPQADGMDSMTSWPVLPHHPMLQSPCPQSPGTLLFLLPLAVHGRVLQVHCFGTCPLSGGCGTMLLRSQVDFSSTTVKAAETLHIGTHSMRLDDRSYTSIWPS